MHSFSVCPTHETMDSPTNTNKTSRRKKKKRTHIKTNEPVTKVHHKNGTVQAENKHERSICCSINQTVDISDQCLILIVEICVQTGLPVTHSLRVVEALELKFTPFKCVLCMELLFGGSVS